MTISNVPPASAIAAIESGVTRVTRRLEIYESDGVTPWVPTNGETRSRLINGGVTLDYTRDDRRVLDIELDNSDGMLSSRDGEGFWYNKILKPFRGVRYGSELWEIQMGEFYIDKIDSDSKTDAIKVGARDPWKKLLNSKMPHSVTFRSGTYLYQLIRSLGANAGITKFKVPFTNEVLTTPMDFERGTERGAVMKQAANAHGYDIFFDNQGFLTMEKFPDPALQPPVIGFSTGPNGNLADLQKSTNDSRLYNNIIVYGDRESVEGGDILMPYFGQAKNEDPNSPTSISQIGDRVYTYASSFFTSNAQAQRLAESWLRIHALETYELSWVSYYYPHLDVGRVVEVTEEDGFTNKYLLDTLNFPLDLSPMGATGKRVIKVQ